MVIAPPGITVEGQLEMHDRTLERTPPWTPAWQQLPPETTTATDAWGGQLEGDVSAMTTGMHVVGILGIVMWECISDQHTRAPPPYSSPASSPVYANLQSSSNISNADQPLYANLDQSSTQSVLDDAVFKVSTN